MWFARDVSVLVTLAAYLPLCRAYSSGTLSCVQLVLASNSGRLCLPARVPFCMPIRPVRLPARLLACPHACRLPARLFACLRARMPGYL